MRTSIVSLGFATATFAKLSLKENVHSLRAVGGEGNYFGGEDMDWWKGSYKYQLDFEFGVRPTAADEEYTSNDQTNYYRTGLWFEFTMWDYNEFFNFATYNYMDRFDIVDVSIDLRFHGPIVPVIFDDEDDDVSGFESSDANIDQYCFNAGYTLHLINNTLKEFTNMKACRQSYMKFIGNDKEMDKTCAYDPAQEGEVTDGYLSIDVLEYLFVEVMGDGDAADQADYDDFWGQQWFSNSNGGDGWCSDFLDF